MTFLNLALLLGGLAAAAPLIIHLFSRSRYKVVPWAAMHLLEPALHRTRRKLRVERWLLLLIRALIPAALAFSFAQPVLTGWKALPGSAPTSAVILLDDSYSMQAGGRFDAAKAETDRVLASLPEGSDATVLLVGGTVRRAGDEATRDLERLRAAVAPLEAEQGPADVGAALQVAAGVLENARHTQRDLIIVSDFQQRDWSEASAASRGQAVQALRSRPLPPVATLLRPGEPAARNIAVESIEIAPRMLGVGQRATIRATLANSGEDAVPDLRVTLRIDGQPREQTAVSLAANQRGQALFTHTFRDAEPHVIEVLAEPDALSFDDAMTAAVEVLESIPVVLIDGAPSAEALRGETDFLAVALQPGQRVASLLRPRVVGWDAFDASALSDARVAVLANAPQLTEPQRTGLEHFVRSGGGLLIFLGDRTSPDAYRDLFNDGRGLLPLPIGAAVTSAAESAPTIAPRNYDHPVLSLFNDPRNGSLADARVRRWRRITETSISTQPADGEAVTLARLTNGDPILIEKSYGSGSVILCATAADADWSDLPLQPVYVPLMQQLVLHLAAAGSSPRTVTTGQPLVTHVPAGEAEAAMTITDPAGVAHEVTAVQEDDRFVVEFPHTDQPGLYALRAGGRALAVFAVNAPREESDLRTLSDQDLLEAAATLEPVLVRSAEEFRQYDRERRHGRELWLPVFWAVVALLFLEMLVRHAPSQRATAPVRGAA